MSHSTPLPDTNAQTGIMPENPLADAISTWQPLRVLNLYRLLVSALLTVLSYEDLIETFFGITNSSAFLSLAVLYLAFALINILTIAWRTPEFQQQLFAQVVIDISLIVALVHVGNGVESGLGVLLIVSIAGHSLLLSGRQAGLFVAIASVALLADQAWLVINNQTPTRTLTHAGLLGITLFVTGFLAIHLAKRARLQGQLATQKSLELANMAHINEQVIQHLESGVVVVSADGKVLATNQQAQRLLGLVANNAGEPLAEHAPELETALNAWRTHQINPAQGFRIPGSGDEIMPRFQSLETRDNPLSNACLVLLQDSATLCQQAQENRLTALGRLTAGIAHEIRNPLSSIRHAGQLLAESAEADPQQQRLTEIIDTNTLRVNSTIESILQLSRRNQAAPESFDIVPWLQQFQNEFIHDHPGSSIRLEHAAQLEPFVFNQGQLRQVLENLCKNAIKHGGAGKPSNDSAKREILIRSDSDNYSRYIEVIDCGPGIDKEALPHLFEPFYSTHTSGTGLGLYIAFELCSSNRAHLEYRPFKNDNATKETSGSCFRISIGH